MRPLLTRRRDLKIFSRSAGLLLKASADALSGWGGNPEEMGLFFGIRKEPSDTGGGDAALLASVKEGRLDESLLATEGKRLSPPLLPLESLPNMCLAHVSIQLGLRGECGVPAGGPLAGVQAVREGIASVAEGRSPAVLAGAVDSWVDGPSQRDWLRMGKTSPPGEAAIVFRLEPEGHPDALFHLERGLCGSGGRAGFGDHHAFIGDCGSADALLSLLMGHSLIVGVEEHGAWAEAKRVREC
jgi:3-oxoacyl-(acyl-carrier-protein) synthase